MPDNHPTEEPHWLDAENGYRLALDDGKLACLNAKGKRLKSVPKKVKDGDLGQQLLALKDFLDEHRRECLQTVETWMLRSLPLPRRVLGSVWPDPAWRSMLENAVVGTADGGGEACGFLRDVRADRGVGVVDPDGETLWLDAESLAIPHPILLADVDDFRELATELGFEQGLQQLFREVHALADFEPDAEATAVRRFSRGKFEQLNHVLGLCRRLGYRTSGGFAVCRVWEGGSVVEARYWIGADYPEGETWTEGAGSGARPPPCGKPAAPAPSPTCRGADRSTPASRGPCRRSTGISSEPATRRDPGPCVTRRRRRPRDSSKTP